MRRCQACNFSSNDDEANFCNNCGAALAGPPVGTPSRTVRRWRTGTDQVRRLQGLRRRRHR